MRSFALLVSLAVVFVAQASSAEQVTQGFAPACSNAACPHPVASTKPEAVHLVGPRLLAPVISSSTDTLAPAPIRDFRVRVAQNVVDRPTSERVVKLHDLILVVDGEPTSSPACETETGRKAIASELDCPAVIAAEVVEILPNSNFMIRGCTESTAAGEIRQQTLTGMVSPKSVTQDRRVRRGDVAELRIAVRKLKLDSSSAVRPASVQESPVAVAVPAPIHDFSIWGASADAVSASKKDKKDLIQEKLSEVARLQREIQQLRSEMGQGQQILMKVRALEVSLTKLRKVGGGTDSSDLRKAIEATSKSSSDGQPYTNTVGTPSAFIDSLIANNVARVLAEPTIVTLSGRPAQFFCGSEIPIPGREGSSSAVEFQKSGTEVDLMAVATNDNRVRLEIRARVSEPDYGHSIRVGDSSIPALRVRQCDTAVETKFGQPVVLDGMIEKRVETIKTEAGTRDVENEIALLFVVTPELVEPLDDVMAEGVVKPVRAMQTK